MGQRDKLVQGFGHVQGKWSQERWDSVCLRKVEKWKLPNKGEVTAQVILWV